MSKIPCSNCNNPRPYKTVSGNGWEYCDRCGDFGKTTVHDVYWKPGFEEHGLADDPNTGKPIVFGSKGEKAAYLKAHGLKEAGDRMGGAPATVLGHSVPQDNPREAAIQALAEVKKMGKDYRRQEFLRIQRESSR